MSLLALDLGTTTGFACSPSRGVIVSGTWAFKPASRFAKLRDNLTNAHAAYKFTRICYEHVRRHLGTQAAHVYGGFEGALITWCGDNNLPAPEGVAVGAIKKFWTGKGNASKEEMIAEALKRGHEPADDNEADALAILYFTMIGAGI